MVSKRTIDDFLSQQCLAVAGVSRDRRKFGNVVYRELKAKGYTVYAVNPNADRLEGDRCYPDLRSIPGTVDGVVAVVQPGTTEALVHEAAEAGIRRIWMQQGAESDAAIQVCVRNYMTAIHGQCILMFTHQTGFPHRAHRWIRGAFGRLPK